MRNNLIVTLLVTSVLFAQEKNFQKIKDSIESLNAVIITTDAIIEVNSTQNKAGSTYFISPKELKPSTMMMFLEF
jgi:hypothetical protein